MNIEDNDKATGAFIASVPFYVGEYGLHNRYCAKCFFIFVLESDWFCDWMK